MGGIEYVLCKMWSGTKPKCKVLSRCGAPVINDTVIESKGINKKKKVIPLIGIILAAVLICGAIIFLFVFSKGKSDNKNAKENVNIDSGNQYLAISS